MEKDNILGLSNGFSSDKITAQNMGDMFLKWQGNKQDTVETSFNDIVQHELSKNRTNEEKARNGTRNSILFSKDG